MNGTAAQASPSRRAAKRRGGGGSGDIARGVQPSERPRGRRGGSNLALSKPITQADLSPYTSDGQLNGEGSSYESATESSDEQESARQERFGKIQAGNQYEQLKLKRESERKLAVEAGLIDDPDKPRSLSDAIRFVGTCTEMCPEFEMHQREYQNNVEKWEISPATGRIDKSRAVKAFHRPAAGNEQPLPSDVRPPTVLVKTLNYLFSTILEGDDDIYATHAFIRDRTRSIRQDFTVQNYRGREAIDCHERIARYHILCLHCLCDNPNFSEQQEMEQLRKVLQSLMEFYKDTKISLSPYRLPNEAEFRAYYALVFLRDQDVSRQLETLPEDIFFSKPMLRSLRLRSLAQRSNDKFVQNNSEAAPNSFNRFFRDLKSSATYLEACILETWFGSIRTGALKALRQALGVKAVQISQISVEILVDILGFDDVQQLVAFCNYLGLETVFDANETPKAIWFKRNSAWQEPATYLHQFSRRIVEPKRHGQTNQSVVNGRISKRREDGFKPAPTNFWNSQSQAMEKLAPTVAKALPSSPVTPHTTPPMKSNFGSLITQTTEKLSEPKDYALPSSNLGEPQIRHVNPPLSVPVPQRAQKSPILRFDSAVPVNDAWTPKVPSHVSAPTKGFSLQPELPVTLNGSSILPSKPSHRSGQIDVTTEENLEPTPLVMTHQTLSTPLAINLRQQSLFDRQEKLLHEELALRERERQSKLDLEDQERRTAAEVGRLQALERAQIRQKEAVLLRTQKFAAQERQRRERAISERRKIQDEQAVQSYAEEIVDTIVQGHIFETTAALLAEAFHRKALLCKTVRRLKVICSRSLRRKKLLLEKIAQSRRRKDLVSRALTELDSGEGGSNSPHLNGRRSHRAYSFNNEEAFQKILVKASEEAKELWKPMDINAIMIPYIDAALSRGENNHSDWVLLMLSAGNLPSEETRWLKTKFGLRNETMNDLRLLSGVGNASIVWSPVMQFDGSLRNVGALVFVYEGDALNTSPDQSNAQLLLHEIVRQTSLQSRYNFPVLVINFNNQQINASEVARNLDLQGLSRKTNSVAAFQVLTICSIGDANLEVSLRSFMRHINAGLNAHTYDPDKDRKRKRGSNSISHNPTSRSPIIQRSTTGDISPPKRVKGDEEANAHTSQTNQKLPRSVESLYKSIMSAQKEMEAGRAWETNEMDEL